MVSERLSKGVDALQYEVDGSGGAGKKRCMEETY